MVGSFLLTGTLVLIFLLTLAYLRYTPPPPVIAGITMHTSVRPQMAKIRAIVPEEANALFDELVRHMTVISQLSPAIDRDEISCVEAASSSSQARPEPDATGVVILPQSGIFADGKGGLSNAMRSTEQSIYHVENPLLSLVKQKERRIETILNEVALVMDRNGDPFKTRFEKKGDLLRDEVVRAKNKVVRACHEQKSRLRVSHPHLARHEFIDESVHDNTGGALPHYVDGDGSLMQPLSRVEHIDRGPGGIIREQAPAS